MRRRQSRSVGRRGGVLIVTLTVLAAGLVASPAQAYDNSTLHYRMATVTTIAGCPTSSPSSAPMPPAVDTGTYCRLSDKADNTFFRKQSGGRGFKCEIHQGSDLVGKVEFHPYGEVLWVYDTRNDGDTIYATIQFELSSGQWATIGTYRPPGTSATIDYNRVDLSWPEVMGARVQVYDDADRTDLLCAGGGRT